MNLNSLEKKSIRYWTSGEHTYRPIKRVITGNANEEDLKYFGEYAQSLLDLFQNYPDNTDTTKKLYRGDILDLPENYQGDRLAYFEEFKKENKVGSIHSLENSVLSFSYDLDTALFSIRNSDKNRSGKEPSVVYKIISRKFVALDISEYSEYKNEREIIIQPSRKYRVVNIEDYDLERNIVLLEIEEV